MRLNRREFLGTICAAYAAAGAEPGRSSILIDEAGAQRLRDFVKRERAEVVERLASAALKAGPWSVTFQRPSGLGVNAGPNDYVSEGPYWWPDPKNPGGPYIRKDGQRNPERFLGNRNDLGSMCSAALALGMGAYLLGKKECSEHANQVLAVWFVDAKTRMNPNLEHGQMVRGINTGRGTGIIDTVSLIHAARGVVLLELAGGLDADVAKGVRKWYADYLNWMMTSRNGLDEKKSGNNHATWWTAQAAAYAAFTGNAEARRMCWNHYREYLVPTEIQPDGSCPREEERTNSLSYSSMNLDAFSTVCRLAQLDGVDLWHFHTRQGIGVDKSFHYLMPYVLDPAKWKKEQISKYNADGYVFPGLAGIGLPDAEMLAAYEKMPRASSAWVQFVDAVVRSLKA